MVRSALTFLAAPFFAAIALAADAPVKTVDGVFVTTDGVRATADGVRATADGMTPYTFDKDATGSGNSACHGRCAASGPPLAAAADAAASGDGTIIVRDDGGRQGVDKGKPVHRWVEGQKPGDRTGDGIYSAWRLARA